jgi:hypothetical protein
MVLLLYLAGPKPGGMIQPEEWYIGFHLKEDLSARPQGRKTALLGHSDAPGRIIKY